MSSFEVLDEGREGYDRRRGAQSARRGNRARQIAMADGVSAGMTVAVSVRGAKAHDGPFGKPCRRAAHAIVMALPNALDELMRDGRRAFAFVPASD
ncbi:MAG: hypothetical protein IT181_12625 [Acidobacteria bacterium]|nr:hypothetical protein [Acidobacteriota bacterium]